MGITLQTNYSHFADGTEPTGPYVSSFTLTATLATDILNLNLSQMDGPNADMFRQAKGLPLLFQIYYCSTFLTYESV